jgi:hypothetical protein
MSASNVVQLVKPEPKHVRKTHNRQAYFVTFIPETGKWLWRVERTRVVVYEAEADTMKDAVKAAERFIDGLPPK